MHQNHEKALRRIFGLDDDRKERLSAKVRELIDTAERRTVRVQGRFREFTYEELVALTIGVSEKEAFETADGAKPEDAATADQFEKMSRSDLLRLCEKRGLRTTGTERHAELSELLRKKAG